MKSKKHWILFALLIGLGLFALFGPNQSLNMQKITTLTFVKFEEQVKTTADTFKGTSDDIKLKHKTYLMEKHDGSLYLFTPKKIYQTKVDPLANSSKKLYQTYNIPYEKEEPDTWFGTLIRYGLIFLVIYILFNAMSPTGRMSAKWKKSKDNGANGDKIPSVTLDQVGGLHSETKEQFLQIITMFKDKERAKQLGIRPPRGALLYGPPGTGKTLSARAIANELGATFYSVSGSEFVEMFVGVGASRVRELFQKARKNSPSLIFIDEIDSIAKKRGNGPVTNEERETTLNELLKEMNGIQENEDVFLIGATNRLDILDEAILRPGRFDYKIYMGLPDLKGRKEIIDIHSKEKALSEDIKQNLNHIAESTAGFSGAELEGIFNTAAKSALQQNRNIIEMVDVDQAIDLLILGNQRNVHLYDYQQRRIAFHEAGHSVVTCFTDPNSIRKVTIIPRGQSLGYMAQYGKEVQFLTKTELLNEVKKCLGGGVAEQIFFGEHANGVGGDVEQAKKLLEHMVQSAMNPEEFHVLFKKDEQEELMKTWYAKAYGGTVELLQKHKAEVQRLAEALLEHKTLTGEEVKEIVLYNEIKSEA
ncbi:AAA family ATPase [Bacillus bombysepticus]|uniref:AAA family ATPase n=1 Tax=Bacillus bombysepticus TaxID=658666 RepID=UPI00301A114E